MAPASCSPQTGGFQSLFATAADNMPPGIAGSDAQPAGGRGSSGKTAAGVAGKKADPSGEAPREAGAVMNAMAAALAQPACPTPPQDSRVGGDVLQGVTSATEIENGSAASVTAANLEMGGTALSASLGMGAAAGEVSSRDLGGLPPGASEADFDNGASPDGGEATAVPSSGNLATFATLSTEQAADVTKTLTSPAGSPTNQVASHNAEALSASTASTGSREPAEAAGASHTRRQAAEKTSAAAGDGDYTIAAATSATGTETVTADPAAAVDLSVQVTAAGPPPANGKSGAAGAANSGDDRGAPTTGEGDGAGPPRSAPATTPTAAAARSSQGGPFPKSEQGADDDDASLPGGGQDLSATVQTAAAGSALGHALAGASQDAARSAPASRAGQPAGVSSPAAAAPATLPAPPLHPAQVLERMDKAEIRIGLQSENFGAIRLHTSVANDQVGASVSTSHVGLRDALFVEAPSLERAMARHSLRLDSVSVDAGSANSNCNSFGSNERQPARPEALPSRWPGVRGEPGPPSGPASSGPAEGSYRLDVRA